MARRKIGMAIQLQKGSGINLTKDHGLQDVEIEVTFEVDPTHPVKAHDMDVNVCAFAVTHKSGKALAPRDEAFVFYNNRDYGNGALTHDEDGGSIGDDKMYVHFGKLDQSPDAIDEVSCIVEIYEGLARGHRFGQFSHCTAHIVNPATKEVIAEFKLSEEDSNATAVQMGSFVKENGHWHFKAIGAGYQKGLADFLHVYGLVEASPE